jgi:hypothetical protein
MWCKPTYYGPTDTKKIEGKPSLAFEEIDAMMSDQALDNRPWKGA